MAHIFFFNLYRVWGNNSILVIMCLQCFLYLPIVVMVNVSLRWPGMQLLQLSCSGQHCGSSGRGRVVLQLQLQLRHCRWWSWNGQVVVVGMWVRVVRIEPRLWYRLMVVMGGGRRVLRSRCKQLKIKTYRVRAVNVAAREMVRISCNL